MRVLTRRLERLAGEGDQAALRRLQRLSARRGALTIATVDPEAWGESTFGGYGLGGEWHGEGWCQNTNSIGNDRQRIHRNGYGDGDGMGYGDTDGDGDGMGRQGHGDGDGDDSPF